MTYKLSTTNATTPPPACPTQDGSGLLEKPRIAARRSYLRAYQAGGVEGLKQLHFYYRPQSELAAHQESLEGYFRAHPVSSLPEARARIAEQSGIERSPTQVRQFLKRLGVKRRKVGMVPAKADVEAQ